MKQYILTLLGLSIFLAGCTNKEQINPNPSDISSLHIQENAQKEMYIQEGYNRGRVVGFQDGVEWSGKAIDGVISEIQAVQFANYLMKEKYIQAGVIYIAKDGKITLSKMEIRKPYTKADIFNKFGAEIPEYVLKSRSNNFLGKDSQGTEKDDTRDSSTPSVINQTIKPKVYTQEAQIKEVNNVNVKQTFISIKNTKTNQDLIKTFGYTAGSIDDKIVIRFPSLSDATDFCNNFDICLGKAN